MSGGETTGRVGTSGPQRTCIGCGRQAEQRELIRLVRSAEGELMVDHPHRLGGRGAYVCSSRSCLSRALRSSRLSRHVGGAVRSPDMSGVVEQIQGRIDRRVEGLLVASGKARVALIGANRVQEALRHPQVPALVVLADDVSPRVRRSLTDGATSKTTVASWADRDRLGRAFARAEVGAVAVTDAGLAGALDQELRLLAGLSVDVAENKPSRREEMALERAT